MSQDAGFVWVEEELVWKRREGATWVVAQPPLPDWAAVRGGKVPAAQFVRLWARAETLNQLKSWLFWLSLEELEQRRAELSAWLSAEGFAPLPALPTRAELPLTRAELQELVRDGCLLRADGDEDDYDYDDESDEEYDDEDDDSDYDDEDDEDDDSDYDEDEDEADGQEEVDLTPAPPRPDEDPWRNRQPPGRMHIETTEDGSWRRFRIKH